MDRFQKNAIRSFRKVKEDMKNLQAQITDLVRKQEELESAVLKEKSLSVKKKRR